MRPFTLIAALALCALAQAQDFRPAIHGTIRGKYEMQTESGEQRFEVRNARVSIDGKVAEPVAYKAEIDLSDEGTIRMLDAFTRITPMDGLDFTLGQMRVPFTIDAHRSPHQQYFANRSFIAKQVGNVRDVGLMVGYRLNVGFPIQLQAGLFNGSGLTNQKNYWAKGLNFSAKAQAFLPGGFCLQMSVQKTKPATNAITMCDAGLYYHAHGWHIEAEYLYKHYSKDSYPGVHAVDAFANYDIRIRGRKPFITKVSPLVRYDFMSDHSDGDEADGHFLTDDYKRSRLTAGVTLSLAAPFVSDIRINYENYFYRSGAIPQQSEGDKIVIEVMTRF